MASTKMLLLTAALAALLGTVFAEDEPEARGRYPPHGQGWQQPGGWQQPHVGHYPHPPCMYRCQLRGCDQFQCHYKCVRGIHCAALGELDARKGLGSEINVSKPLKEKVDAFDYVPPKH
ncbi:uncharacterized protein LOC144139677 [Haemaphysalis longicornis]